MIFIVDCFLPLHYMYLFYVYYLMVALAFSCICCGCCCDKLIFYACLCAKSFEWLSYCTF